MADGREEARTRGRTLLSLCCPPVRLAFRLRWRSARRQPPGYSRTHATNETAARRKSWAMQTRNHGAELTLLSSERGMPFWKARAAPRGAAVRRACAVRVRTRSCSLSVISLESSTPAPAIIGGARVCA